MRRGLACEDLEKKDLQTPVDAEKMNHVEVRYMDLEVVAGNETGQEVQMMEEDQVEDL